MLVISQFNCVNPTIQKTEPVYLFCTILSTNPKIRKPIITVSNTATPKLVSPMKLDTTCIDTAVNTAVIAKLITNESRITYNNLDNI